MSGLICHRLCRHKPGYVVAKVQDGEIDLTKLAENSNYHTTGAALHPKLELLEYPRNDIIYIRDIGQGAFGRVFQVPIFLTKVAQNVQPFAFGRILILFLVDVSQVDTLY